MIDPRVVLTVFCLYLGSLISIGLWVERKSAVGRTPANNPFVYSLSLAVYCTAWTYYGSVGKAATSGMLFLPIYLGPTISIFIWWILLRRLVQIKNTHRITSIADFISARYNKSQLLASIATLIAIVGVVPYVALQLKAIIATFDLITTDPSTKLSVGSISNFWIEGNQGLVVTIVLILFTIMLGVRRLDPTERHDGMVIALAVECLVKLVAFLAAGVFVTYFIHDGLTDIFKRLSDSPYRDLGNFWGKGGSSYLTWTTYLVLSMSAILFLPRQFHVAVVENHDEKHILTAMWVFPLYMLLINVFVLPIAIGGLLKGYPIDQADTFVLMLPLHHAGAWLPLLVFIGGFSAAAGMVMVSSVTIATMITNHLLLPLVQWVPRLGFLKRHLLKCRWGAVAAFVFSGYWFEIQIIESYTLVNIGLISFAAVFQYAPVILGGIFWPRGNKAGAILGLTGGFTLWCYTQLLPSFVRNGWLSSSLIDEGPWGIGLLKPEALFGLSGLDTLSHTMLWTMLVNTSLYVLGSLFFVETEERQSLAQEFVGDLAAACPPRRIHHGEAYIELAVKRREIEHLLDQYFPAPEALAIVEKCLEETDIRDKSDGRISIVQLVELHGAVEKCLAGSIGSAAAHKALREGTLFTPREARELSDVYADILADLRLTPTELQTRIDYHREKEMLLLRQAKELEQKVLELEQEIMERKKAQEAVRALEREKANIISMFAHDMRSSITGIHGLGLRLLTKSASMDEEKRNEHLGIINKEAAKLESLVDDFLEFSRLETGRLKLNFQATSLDKELMELFEVYRVRASQKGISMGLQLGDALPIIEADVNRLRRVFTNLLDNALKFSGENGTVTIAARETVQEVVIQIIDEGIGIDPREIPYIFDLFHRGRGARKKDGYGIGLATAKAIVEGHGGRIKVVSEPGRGSTFSIELPKKQEIGETILC